MFKATGDLIRYLGTQGWSENRHCEFKSGAPWDRLKHTLAKAALAMANLPGGGYIIIGVSESGEGGVHEPTGLSEQDSNSYSLDGVSEFFNVYADPYVDIDMKQFEHKGRFLVVMQVGEFTQTPVVCKKNGEKVSCGTIYCRSHRKPESIAVPSSAEMGEIVDMAVDKGMQRQYRRLQSYGADIDGRLAGGEDEAASQPAEKTANRIAERGHWKITITPTAYPVSLHSLNDLQATLKECQVRLRDWHYPYISSRHGEMYNLNRCVEAWLQWYTHAEVFRLYEHGRFVHRMGMVEDWGDGNMSPVSWDESTNSPAASNAPYLNPVLALHHLTEIHLFASKIANKGILGDELEVDVTLYGQGGRVLSAIHLPFFVFDGGKSRAPSISLGPLRTTPAELRARHDEMAIAAATRLFTAYNFPAEDLEKTMRGWQAELYGRRF